MKSIELKNYLNAGKIWRKAINYAEKKAKKETLLLKLAEGIEELIIEEGGEIAFPVNLSTNEQAAHYTPKYGDLTILKESDVLKIDVGVAVNGFICDGAITINLDNTHAKQIEANKLALENAISVTKEGEPIQKIGEKIETTLKNKGFNPVYNLGGHGLGKNEVHAWPSIPNHSGGSSEKIREGMALAIEPFASSGEGRVSDDASVEIFSLKEKKGVRNPNAKKILNFLDDFSGKPFAERWIRKKFSNELSEFGITMGLRELMRNGLIHPYAGLKEAKGTIVTQVEKTVLINEGKTIILGE